MNNYDTLSAMEKATLPILTVSQLTQAIKLSLEATFPLLSIQGEVSNFKKQASGHLYFSIKDASAQISAVMFRNEAASLKVLPKEGDQVVVLAELTVYPPRGSYQLVVRELRLAGIGELLLKLEELKQKLQKRGWFDREHKKPLPQMPKKIGVVTSPTGAVIQDILNVLTRRHSTFHLILNPVKVQGEGAAEEIARAIEQFNQFRLVDVIIVGRGGGSIEDLWAFNEERVAEAIFKSQIPVVSAIGHETDTTIADFVADVRAPTPSAAAEIVIAEKAQQLQHLATLSTRLKQTIWHLLKQYRTRLAALMRHPLYASPYSLLGVWMQRLDQFRIDLDKEIRSKLAHAKIALASTRQRASVLQPTARIQTFKQRLQTLDLNLQRSWAIRQAHRHHLFEPALLRRQLEFSLSRQLKLYRERLDQMASAVRAIDPANLLARGYTIVFSEKDGSVISSVQALHQDQAVQIRLSDGKALATINQTFPEKP